MNVIVTLAIPLSIANEVDVLDKTIYMEWYRNAVAMMVKYPERTYIKVRETQASDLERSEEQAPEAAPLAPPSSVTEQWVADLLKDVDF